MAWSEMPRSPGHVFYNRLQAEFIPAGFDGFVERLFAHATRKPWPGSGDVSNYQHEGQLRQQRRHPVRAHRMRRPLPPVD